MLTGRFDNVVVGHTEEWIELVATEIPEFFESMSIVMTRRDSGAENIRWTKDFTEKYDIEYRGDACVCASPGVQKLIEDDWPFDGFDEFFLVNYDDIPSHIDAIDTQFLATTDLSGKKLEVFIERFRSLNAKRFLGDGLGLLNFVCEERFVDMIVAINEEG